MLLRLGLAHYLVPRGKYREAEEVLSDGLENFPENPLSSRLMFYRAIARYLVNRGNKSFKSEMAEIKEKYPNSLEADIWPWTKI